MNERVVPLPKERGRKAPVSLPADLPTEDAAALAFAAKHGGDLLYDHDAGTWFRFEDVWRRERTGLAFAWARELVRGLVAGTDEKTRRTTERSAFAAGVERFARSDRAFAVTSKVWDPDPFLLGTPAGTVDLRTGERTASLPEHRITKATAVPPDATADCPTWLRFLEEATGGDRELIRFLQRWTGYGLTGDTREHALVFVYGGGGNGKSVYLNTVTGILGDYAATAAMDTFTASASDRHSTDLAMLRGARLVTASETEEGRAWAEQRIKSITGGDPITARFMRQDNFTYVPQFKLTVIGNHKPVLKNVDDAMKRRFNIVPFNRKPAKPDRELEAKLQLEWPAILRWMIDGCLDWQRNGLVRPRVVVAETEAYFAEQDIFAQWLDERCDTDPGNGWKKELSAALFADWSSYAAAAGEHAGTKKAFSEAMQRRGFETHRGTGGARSYLGVRLRPTANRQWQ